MSCSFEKKQIVGIIRKFGSLQEHSYNAILEVRKSEEKEMEQWKGLTLSTDFKKL